MTTVPSIPPLSQTKAVQQAGDLQGFIRELMAEGKRLAHERFLTGVFDASNPLDYRQRIATELLLEIFTRRLWQDFQALRPRHLALGLQMIEQGTYSDDALTEQMKLPMNQWWQELMASA